MLFLCLSGYDIFNCSWVATRWQQCSSHIHTDNKQNDTKHTIHTTQKLGRMRAVPRLCGFYPGICLTTEKKARKNLRVAIHKHTIRIHSHKPHATKEHRGVVVCCIHSVGTATGGELSASRSGSFFTPGERPRCALGRRLCGVNPRAGLVAFSVWRKSLVPAGNGTRILQSSARSLVTVLTTLGARILSV
jgi:hypothetical protein